MAAQLGVGRLLLEALREPQSLHDGGHSAEADELAFGEGAARRACQLLVDHGLLSCLLLQLCVRQALAFCSPHGCG